MLESLVASILNRFLKNYVSNLNYDQLKIGIWNGKWMMMIKDSHSYANRMDRRGQSSQPQAKKRRFG